MSDLVLAAPHNYGLIVVSGVDASKLLQGQLSCDVMSLCPGHSILGAQCNRQGKVLVLMSVLLFAGNYYLLVPDTMSNLAVAALHKYAMFYKVTINSVATISHPVLAHLINLAWLKMQIRHTCPQIHPETSGKFFPHDLDLPKLDAISWTKGCYTGQEIVARMHYRGTLKKTLLKINLYSHNPIVRGADLAISAIAQPVVIVDYYAHGNNYYTLLVLAPKHTTDHH